MATTVSGHGHNAHMSVMKNYIICVQSLDTLIQVVNVNCR